MKLKSIELMGFKSFPEKTCIGFDGGLTAIVGPNGSGKSNISDAVRWVLGEMSLKSLRGTRMEDIIFNGTQKRSAANYAYVSLYLDTSAEYAAGDSRFAEWQEVVITRKYYRSGESEYYINKKQVRLKDIYELFYDTGIGREGYSVIGQGKISEVLSVKGDERRDIFEEAAGISKYRYKKIESERKLRDTENNLVRINDIMGELGSRLAPLEKEAENAKKYLTLSEEKKGLEITLWLEKIERLKAELDDSANVLAALKLELDLAEEDVLQSQAQLEDFTTEGYALMQKRGELERTAANAQVEIESRRGKISLQQSEINHFLDRIQSNQTEITALSLTLASTQEELLQAEEALQDMAKSLENAELSKHQASQEYTSCQADAATAQQLEQAARQSVEQANLRLAEINGEMVRAMTMAENAEKLKESYTSRVTASQAEIARLNADLEVLNANITQKTAQFDQLRQETTGLEQETADIANKLSALNGEIAAQNVKIAQKEQEREGLVRLERLFEGYSDAVKTILRHAAEGKIGKITVHGTVASLMSTDGEHALALETALGAAAQFIVVETEQDAKTAIKYLKDTRSGRGTFLPVDTIKGRKAELGDAVSSAGFVGIASDLVRCDKHFRGIAENLLGRTIIAHNLDYATNIAKLTTYRHKIVTSDGQVINAGGSYTGGSTPQKAGVFTRLTDIERLDGEIRTLNGSLMNSELTAKKLAARQDAINGETAQKRGEITLLLGEIEELKRQKSAVEARCDHESNHLAGLLEISDQDQSAALDALMAQLQAEKATHRTVYDDFAAQLAAATQAYALSRTHAEVALKNLNAAEIAEITQKTGFENAQNRLENIKNKLKTDKNRQILLENECAEFQQKAEQAKQAIAAEEAEIAQKNQIIAQSTDQIDQINQRIELREMQEKELKSAQKSAVLRKEQAFQSHASAQLKQEGSGNEHQRLTDLLWDEYELTYSDACQFRLPSEKMQKAPSRLNSLKNQIRALGAINVNAVEEYRSTKERHDFLKAQTDDLIATRRSLDSAIAKLNQTMRTVFVDTFNRINAEFNDVFTQLFGGGSARIELTDPDSPLESGIDIILRLPGKSVKSIALLSGGEQSFAAIALYLALQNINPSPFCIFDEIETALDDVNLVRFVDYIKRHCNMTQYIIITHRRGTMERADTIYGITMREKGVSEYLKLDVAVIRDQ